MTLFRLKGKSQKILGLHQKKCSQLAEGFDTASLLHIGMVSPRALSPDVESSVQDRCRPLEACPEKGHKKDPWNGTPVL